MAEQFEDQGGAATSDPSALMRWVTSRVARRLIAPGRLPKQRARAERARRKAGARHRVDYFHQVDDGYSHLAAQLLRPLVDRYDVELVCHLVTVARDRNLPEPDLFADLSRRDSAQVAPHYGLRFPENAPAPSPDRVGLASQILAAVEPAAFPEASVAVGDALWNGDSSGLAALAERFGRLDPSETEARVQEGTELRGKLGHYSGAMFHCAGEWYWGADRFYHLENRLVDERACKSAGGERVCPRPGVEAGPLNER